MRIALCTIVLAALMAGCTGTPPAPIQPSESGKHAPDPSSLDATPRLIHTIRVEKPVRTVKVSPSGEAVAVISYVAPAKIGEAGTYAVSVHNAGSGKQVFFHESRSVMVADWSEDDVLALSNEGQVRLIDRTGAVVGNLRIPSMATWFGSDTINVEPMVGDKMIHLLDLAGQERWSEESIGSVRSYAFNGTHFVGSFDTSEGPVLALVSLSGEVIWRQKLTSQVSWLGIDRKQHVYANSGGTLAKFSPEGTRMWSHPIASPGAGTLWLRGETAWVHQPKPEPHVLRISSDQKADVIPLPEKGRLVNVSPDGRWLLAGEAESNYLTRCYLLSDTGVSMWHKDLERGGCIFASSAPVLAVWSGTTVELYAPASK